MILSKKRILNIGLFLSLFFLFERCDVARQAQQASNLANCEFRIQSVGKVNLAGVELQYVRSVNDLSIMDAARIMAGFTSPVFPLSMQLNIEGRNPNAQDAGLNRLDWILYIDDIHMTSGVVDRPVIIPAMGSDTLTVEVGLDLKQALSGKSSAAMLNFCMNLAGVGNTPTRFKIKLKPTVIVAGTALTYPGYITVNTTYSSK